MDKFIPTNTVHWIHLVCSQKCDFFIPGYVYLDCAYSSCRDPFEIKLLDLHMHGYFFFFFFIKLKFVDALLLLSELAAKI